MQKSNKKLAKVPFKPSSQKLQEGFSTLSGLWKRGLYPEDLKRHYSLHWFVAENGNIMKAARTLQIHRNTIQGYFLELGYGNKGIRLRRAWQELSRNSTASFAVRFLFFYRKFTSKPKLSPKENSGLVTLWQTRFPYKILTHHYLLWALRNGRSKEWLQARLDYSYRHQARLLSQILNPKAKQASWLNPLKPKVSEIYSKRYRARLASKGKK